MELILAALPILLVVVCGYGVAATGMLPASQWDGVNILCFWVLIPVTLLKAIAVSDLEGLASGAWAAALLGTLAVAALVVLALRYVVSEAALPNPAFTSLFQATTRWNAFVALAAAEQFIGPSGLALLAVAMAVLVPVINTLNIVVLVVFGSARASLRGVVIAVLRNPMVVACVIGLAINGSGLRPPVPVLETLDLIGRAALGMGLLAVGAGIGLERLFSLTRVMALGVTLRLALLPPVFLGLASLFGLGELETLAGCLMFTVPAAANGYVIARQMGGDADLYVDIMTWQTVVSLGLLPVYAGVVAAMF